MTFAKFMASPAGRWIRVVLGIVLIALGLSVYEGMFGIALAVIGFVPLMAGGLDVCILAPLFGAPFQGSEIRSKP